MGAASTNGLKPESLESIIYHVEEKVSTKISEVMNRMENKLDRILEDISDLKTNQAIFEEWRRGQDAHKSVQTEDLKEIKSRLHILESYKWFLVGISASISISVAVFINYVFEKVGL